MQQTAQAPGWLAIAALLGAVLLGIAFRTVWGEDIEYKGDERYSFLQSQAIVRGEPLPSTGMPSSMGPPNAGLSVWIFAGLARLSGAGNPPSLARTVEIFNATALVLLLVFAVVSVPAEQRESWFWAVALVSVNPLAVLTQRKLWPLSTLPLFTLAMVVGWWHRRHGWGAMLWGVTGALIGQIHIPSAFLSLGFALWTWLFDRRSVRWGYWLLGSGLAALPALPWAWAVLHWTGPHGTLPHWQSWIQFRFWLTWIPESFGFGLGNGLKAYSAEFIAWPRLLGRPTYSILIIYIGLGSIAVATLGRAIEWMIRERLSLGEIIVGRATETDFTISAALWGCGLVLTASSVPFHWHYMIGLFFLQHLWVGRLMLKTFSGQWARRMLIVLFLGEALVTARFLVFVHGKDDVPGAYGIPWRAQQAAGP